VDTTGPQRPDGMPDYISEKLIKYMPDKLPKYMPYKIFHRIPKYI